MSSTRIEQLIDDVQAAFDRPPREIEEGLDVEDAALLQLRKACRLLAGAESLRRDGYFTLVIEASFVAIERSIEFRLLERGTLQPTDLPGTHPGVYREAAAAGIVAESTAEDLADLWRDHREKNLLPGRARSGGPSRRNVRTRERDSRLRRRSFVTGIRVSL
ncbi:HEPN domain containing protein [Halorhabdus sp. BNX81]|nr:hypothetical protein [Halorhabdus sp. BNX81]WEL20814.1 HEPN domain containing protein [Halorhabdus sp. BNX81]